MMRGGAWIQERGRPPRELYRATPHIPPKTKMGHPEKMRRAMRAAFFKGCPYSTAIHFFKGFLYSPPELLLFLMYNPTLPSFYFLLLITVAAIRNQFYHILYG